MRNPNDPAGGKENDFLSAHDQLLAGLNSPAFASLNISAADKATIAEDNAALHRAKTAADNAKALARSTNQTKASIIKRSDKNYRTIRGRIMVSPGYSVGSGVALGLEHTTGVAPGTTSVTGPQPVLRAKALDTGGVKIKSTKGKAEAVDLYCKRAGDADFVRIMRVLHFPYTDDRPLLVTGQPETREYRAMLIRNEQPYGRMSNSITVIASA